MHWRQLMDTLNVTQCMDSLDALNVKKKSYVYLSLLNKMIK